MKNLSISKSIIALFLISFAFTSCKKSDICEDVTCPSGYICNDGNCIIDPNEPTPETNEVKSGVITSNETWVASKIYELAGKVIISSGATLTIEPGTIIKGRQGQGSLASALIIARDAQIMANGTSDHPIIFTSILDNISIGEMSGTNLDETDASKWGGLIVLGNAKISAKVGDTEAQIEGIPADEEFGKYGGSNDSDNSGVITYVSIRHGGALIGEGNEINGLTLGGVGNGTIINHIEVMANLDDGIECFGGSVNIDNAIVAFQGDDALDIDQNYSGTISNSVVIYDNSGDEFLEIDGPENATHVGGLFTIQNSTFISNTNDGSVDLKSKAQGNIINCHFTGLSKFKISASFTDNCTVVSTDAYDNLANGTLIITSNNTEASLEIYTKSEYDNETLCPVLDDMNTTAQGIYSNGNNNNTVNSGADISEFTGWTWSAINNKL